MCFALLSFLLATSQRAQAQTREAYVAQSAGKTTLTFYYDALRATRAGTTWGILERKYVPGDDTYPEWTGISEEVDTTIARVVFDASFRDFRPTTTARWFSHCKALKQIEGLEYLNTSKVDDMSAMFCGCSALTSLDLQHFNTQNVEAMFGMFRGCTVLTSLDLPHFNTQKLLDTRKMFDGCSSLTSLDLQHFDPKKETDMRRMFYDCAALTTIHSNTTWQCQESEDMFAGCTKLKGAVAYDKNKV
ncbi:MAG: BspA family leucine-rich repeat surface protein, partial [Prevotellaceae bacterium]|nr:BspA family leucine-rich repeat surface protein [Prevotellaceae bacterium]